MWKLALLGLTGAALCAQDVALRPAFAVSSIKPNREAAGIGGAPRRVGDRVTWINVPLPLVVYYAYNISPVRFSGNVPFDFYNIEAVTEGSPTEEQLRRMFRTLLEDRFGLKAYFETRERDVSRLVIAKDGVKLKPAAEETIIAVDGRPLPAGARGIFVGQDGAHLAGKRAKFADLVGGLSGALQRPVLDETGITGTFDYDVRFRLDSDFENPNGNPYIGAAIESVLGLRLESGRGPVEMLVLDSIGKPTEN